MKIVASKINLSLKAVSGLLSVAMLCSCSIFASNQELPDKKPQVFKVSFRQLPPDPVYNRLRVTNLPYTMPEKSAPHSRAAQLDPMVKLSLKNNTLEQAAIALSSLGDYKFYTASSVAKQKLTLEAYGTLEEVANQIAFQSGTHVVVDHPNRQIRILRKNNEGSGTEPSFAKEEVVNGINKSQ